jgi:hypothetical protein
MLGHRGDLLIWREKRGCLRRSLDFKRKGFVAKPAIVFDHRVHGLLGGEERICCTAIGRPRRRRKERIAPREGAPDLPEPEQKLMSLMSGRTDGKIPHLGRTEDMLRRVQRACFLTQ